MIELSPAYEALSSASNQSVVGVLEISFTNGSFIEGVNSIFIATHEITELKDGVVNPLPSPNNWFPFLSTKDIAVIADGVDDKTGVASIGSWSAKFPDVNYELSNIFRLMDEAGFGLNRQVVEYYEYPRGGTFDDGIKLETKEVSGVTKDKNMWVLKMSSALESANSPCMALHSGVLAVNMLIGDTSLSIQHMQGDGDVLFPFVVGKSLLKIGDEVMLVLVAPTLSADGLTLSFSSVQRGLIGTVAATHDLGDDVKENVRIKANPIDLALMLLTGYVPAAIGYWSNPVKWNWYNIANQAPPPPGVFYKLSPFLAVRDTDAQLVSVPGGITYTYSHSYYSPDWVAATPLSQLPKHWHAGMEYVNQIDVQQWATVQNNLAQQADGVGDIEDAYDFLFDKPITSTKVFVEREIMMLMSLRMYPRPDGRLGLYVKRDISEQPIQDAPSLGDWRNAVLDDDTVVDFGSLSAVKRSTLMKTGTLLFGFIPRVGKGEAKRSVTFSDAFAAAKHGADAIWEISSRGLDAANASAVRAAVVRLGRTVQRYMMPLRSITIEAMPMMMPYEVGDVLRVRTDAVHDYLTGKGLNRCFEIVGKSYHPFTRTPTFKLIAQTEQAKPVPYLRYRSPYADSAFLNGLTAGAVPANRNILLLNPNGNSMTLTDGDWYIPIGDGNTYTAFGKWVTKGSVRVFCSGEFIQDELGELDGFGRGGQADGYAEAGHAGEQGEMTVYHENGSWNAWKFVCQKDPATTHSQKSNSWYPQGYLNPNAFAFDIQSKTIVNGDVTALKGIPSVYLGGARGGQGGAAVPTGYALGSKINLGVHLWAIKQGLCVASLSEGKWYTYNYTGVVAPASSGVGGAGFLMCARKQVWNGTVNLGGTPGGAAKETVIPKIDIEVTGCNDRIKIVAKTGKSGAGSRGAFITISEADVFKGAHIANATINAVYKEYLI